MEKSELRRLINDDCRTVFLSAVMGMGTVYVTVSLSTVYMNGFEGNRKALVEKSGLVKHAAGSTKLKDSQSRQALSAEQQQRNAAHRCVSPP